MRRSHNAEEIMRVDDDDGIRPPRAIPAENALKKNIIA